jgi:hypothetical protein
MNDQKESRAVIPEERVKRGLKMTVVVMVMMGRNKSKSDWCPPMITRW